MKSQTAETAATNAPAPPTDAWRYGWGSYDEAKQRVSDFRLTDVHERVVREIMA